MRTYEFGGCDRSRGFSGAISRCEKRNQTLLRIEDNEELDFVIGHLQALPKPFQHLLTGLRVIPRTTGWTWELKAARAKLTWFDGWAPEEPKPVVNARCGAITSKGWVAMDCSQRLPYYICLGRESSDSKDWLSPICYDS